MRQGLRWLYLWEEIEFLLDHGSQLERQGNDRYWIYYWITPVCVFFCSSLQGWGWFVRNRWITERRLSRTILWDEVIRCLDGIHLENLPVGSGTLGRCLTIFGVEGRRITSKSQSKKTTWIFREKSNEKKKKRKRKNRVTTILKEPVMVGKQLSPCLLR